MSERAGLESAILKILKEHEYCRVETGLGKLWKSRCKCGDATEFVSVADTGRTTHFRHIARVIAASLVGT